MKLSDHLWERSRQVIPGGVNSPVRSFANVGIDPIFIERAAGACLVDTQGRQYLDFINSWGALLFGHSYPPVMDQVVAQIGSGVSYGLATALEVEFAEQLVAAVPTLEMVRLVNSGTEATMSALRLARGFTGRAKILKFAGCYHGHSNELLVDAGSGALTFGIPSSAGVTAATAQDTLVCPYNDLASLTELFARYGETIAAVIVEPVAANMGLVLPEEGFLPGLRQLTTEYGALLIFDEVITGFRLAYGGAQQFYQVRPDLTCFGKVIGGGFPIGAYGGRRELMEYVAPCGPVYQAGTLAGNPVAVRAGLATLALLEDGTVYQRLARLGEGFRGGVVERAAAARIELQVSGVGSLTGICFASQPVRNHEQLATVDQARYRQLFQLLLREGVLFPPSPFETVFISAVHTEEQLCQTLEIIETVLRKIA